MKNIMEIVKKVIFYTFGSILVTSLCAAIFSLIRGNDLLNLVFTANYIVATIIMAVGVFSFFLPVGPLTIKRLKKTNPLIDHSNMVDVLREEKEVKISEAIINICWGICHVIFVGILEIVVKYFI